MIEDKNSLFQFEEDGVLYSIFDKNDLDLGSTFEFRKSDFNLNPVQVKDQNLALLTYVGKDFCETSSSYGDGVPLISFYCDLKINFFEKDLIFDLDFFEKELIGNYDLAVEIPCPNCIGCLCDPYAMYLGGKIDTNFGVRYSKSFDQNKITYWFNPFEYDPNTKELFLYKKVNLKLKGQYRAGAVLEKFIFDESGIKKNGETLNATATVVNKSGIDQNVCLQLEKGVLFENKKELQSVTCLVLKPTEKKNIDLNFIASPDIYPNSTTRYDNSIELFFALSSNNNLFYNTRKLVSVRPINVIIVDQNVPSVVYTDAINEKFNFSIKNADTIKRTVFIKTIIYTGGAGMELVQNLLQSQIDINSGETVVYTEKWSPKLFFASNPDKLKLGQHIAQTTFDSGGYIQTMTNYFELKER